MSTQRLSVSSSPHIRSELTTRRIMLDVVIALLPALVAAGLVFGPRALLVVAVSVAASVAFEWLYRLVTRQPNTVGDLTAVVTGMLLAYCLPATVPYWMVVAGDFFAIVIVKQLFGGLGKNLFNPALAGRAFLFCWPVAMVRYAAPGAQLALFGSNVDMVSAATPLHSMVMLEQPEAGLLDMFLGKIGGSIGEVSALALLLGGGYLLVRRVIRPQIPLAYLGTVAVLTFLFARGDGSALNWMLYNLLGGGLLLGALFMATDYATSPVTPVGRVLYGVGCGLLTVLLRYWSLYPEGVSYSILIMNACVVLFDRIGAPRRFGAKGKGGAQV